MPVFRYLKLGFEGSAYPFYVYKLYLNMDNNVTSTVSNYGYGYSFDTWRFMPATFFEQSLYVNCLDYFRIKTAMSYQCIELSSVAIDTLG